MTCHRCGAPQAGMRYQGWWFHAGCWEKVRTFAFLMRGRNDFPGELTATGECADNGDAETAGPATVLTVSANPPTPLGSSKRHLGAAVSVDGAADLAQSQTAT